MDQEIKIMTPAQEIRFKVLYTKFILDLLHPDDDYKTLSNDIQDN